MPVNFVLLSVFLIYVSSVGIEHLDIKLPEKVSFHNPLDGMLDVSESHNDNPDVSLHLPESQNVSLLHLNTNNSEFVTKLVKNFHILIGNSSNLASEMPKSFELKSFLDELAKMSPKKVYPIFKLLSGLIQDLYSEIKGFKDSKNKAHAELVKAQGAHGKVKARFVAKTKELGVVKTAYDNSVKELADANVKKGVADNNYNQAKISAELAAKTKVRKQSVKDQAETKYNNVKTQHNNVGKELNDANTLKGEAETKYNAAKTTYSNNEPVLLKNIQIIQSVIIKLDELFPWTLVADVGGRASTTKSFWQGYCSKLGDVTVHSMMRITMGQYVDYYRPTSKMSFCNFILGRSFTWSARILGPYVAPKLCVRTGKTIFGCIHSSWVKANDPYKRCFLPIWGLDAKNHGGYGALRKECNWYRPFKMHMRRNVTFA